MTWWTFCRGGGDVERTSGGEFVLSASVERSENDESELRNPFHSLHLFIFTFTFILSSTSSSSSLHLHSSSPLLSFHFHPARIKGHPLLPLYTYTSLATPHHTNTHHVSPPIMSTETKQVQTTTEGEALKVDFSSSVRNV